MLLLLLGTVTFHEISYRQHMIFSSNLFLLIFLPITWLVFIALKHWLRAYRAGAALLLCWLLIASLLFYAQWSTRDLGVLLFVVLVNWVFAYLVSLFGSRFWLPLIVVVNLAVIGFFKYWPLAQGDTSTLIITAGLPLGVSFYIFQAIAYQVDHSRGVIGLDKGLYFPLFLCFFPQLIAGPIVHGRQLIPQLKKITSRPIPFTLGLSMLAIGLAKKVLVADTLAGGVNAIYAGTYGENSIVTLAAGVTYGTQLYFDFSGYADMAVGVGLLFGLKLPQNFNQPYNATSVTLFWRRWHMTLSRFLRDYVYIPLGGNRKSESHRLANLLLTMGLGGIWHGAGLQFLVWGFLHGCILSVEHLGRRHCGVIQQRLPRAVRWFLTFTVVMLLWIPFRANDLHHAAKILSGIQTLPAVVWPSIGSVTDLISRVDSSASSPETVLFCSLVVLALVATRPTSWRWALQASDLKRSFTATLLLLLVLKTLVDRPDAPFLYFQF